MSNKEQVYDAQIAPLMTQIIEVCQKHGVAMLASFAIPTPDDDGLQCTTFLPDENDKHPPHHVRAYRQLNGEHSFMAVTITSPKVAS